MVGTIKETSAVGFNKCISAEGRGWDNRCYHGWLDDIGRGDNTSAPVVLFVIGCGKWGVGHVDLCVGGSSVLMLNVRRIVCCHSDISNLRTSGHSA